MERTTTKTRSAKTNQFILSQFFTIGSLQIRWYGLTMAGAIALGYFIGRWRAKRENFSLELFDDLSFWLVIISFLSARVYYVLFYPQFYRGNFAEVFKIWHGGLAIYGALIGGLLTTFFYARKKKIAFLKLSDVLVFTLPLAQAIGRFGNYFNYEAFGNPTNLPWKMFVPLQFRPQGFENFSYFHPTFAYEAIWDALVFFALFWFGRYFFGLRGDQITAVLIALLGIAIFFVTSIKKDAPETY